MSGGRPTGIKQCAQRRCRRWLLALAAGGLAAVGSLRAAQETQPPPPPPTEAEIRQALVEEIARAKAARERQENIVTARQRLQAQDYAAAADLLTPLIADQPEAGLYLALGQAEIGLQQFAQAEGSLRKALELDAGFTAAQRGLGWLAFRAQDYGGALRRWEPLIQAGQRDGELLERAGQCYYFTQQRRAALACFEAAALGRPEDRELDRWRIFCAQDVGEFEAADRLARTYLTARPADVEVRRIAAHSAAALQRREDAILQLERLNLDGHMAPTDWQLLSELYSLAGDDSRAADCLEAAWPVTVTDAAGATVAGRAQLTADDWLRLAGLQERAGRLSRAATYYGQIAADSPAFPEAALGLARLAQARQDAAAAITQCRAALKARPDLTAAQLILGWACESSGQADEAATAYRAAASTPRLAAEAHLGLARIAYRANRLAEALREYQAAADLRPEDRALPAIVQQLNAHLAAADAP